ncbi:MAG: single-stranded-DNA-specific exonuclease RecJ [Oscillospiraceae bacterium]|nr:single-stranded-DNA-specific exonuclease RecJ [Oscillospiraceae bacterium]
MKKWVVSMPDREKVNNITKRTDLGSLVAEVMVARGYSDIDDLASFFNNEELSDPFLLLDMPKAVKVINDAIESGELICIYGDYDCDGVTSTAVLHNYLSAMGANVCEYIPEREEGYGLNFKAIDEIKANGVSLIITVDNGISAIKEAEYIAECGIKLVITDHHQPQAEIPKALAVVDPFRPGCPSPFKNLAGVGVVLKLCAALDYGNYDLVLEQYADLVAIGTIADVVPLIGENRTIVRHGLRLLKNTENYGLLSLLEGNCVNLDNLTSNVVAFCISPRINAAGRFGSPITALEALITEDESAYQYANELCRLNDLRKSCECDIVSDIKAQIAANAEILNERVLIVSGSGWHHGVIGIVASKLMEEYEKPVVILSSDGNGISRGSARSMPGFNIFKCFDYCRDLMIKYGGHECAGGLTISDENIPAFRQMVSEYAKVNHDSMPKITIAADKLLRGADISVPLVEELSKIEPYGTCNTEPVFAISGAEIRSIIPLKNGEHTKLEISYDGVKAYALMFKAKTAELPYKVGDRIDLMVNLSANEFKGTKSVTLKVIDSRLHGVKQERFFAAMDAYERFVRSEDQPKEILAKGNPTREELVAVYKYIASLGSKITFEALYARLLPLDMNAFKLRIIIEAFADTGLLTYSKHTRSIEISTPTARVDIESSVTLKKLRNLL